MRGYDADGFCVLLSGVLVLLVRKESRYDVE